MACLNDAHRRITTIATTKHDLLKFLPESRPGQAVQVEIPGEVGHTEHEEKVVQKVMNITGSVAVEEDVERHEGNSDENKGDGDDDDGDGDRRGFLPATVFLVLSSRRQFLSGFLHGDGELLAQDGVADDETGTGKDGVDEHADRGPGTDPEDLVVSGTDRAAFYRPVAGLHHRKPVHDVGVK